VAGAITDDKQWSVTSGDDGKLQPMVVCGVLSRGLGEYRVSVPT
jgi:hypothetical protein